MDELALEIFYILTERDIKTLGDQKDFCRHIAKWHLEKLAQLETDLERHEAKIKHYPDSYLGKIFFQGVDQGRKQLEAENERLAQIVADRTPFIYATYAADDLVEALHPGIIFEEARFALAEYVRKRKQCPDKVGGALKAGDIGE